MNDEIDIKGYGLPRATGSGPVQHGLTKLEYGALQIAAAMTAIGSVWPDTGDRHEIARRSVLIASAVLAEANK